MPSGDGIHAATSSGPMPEPGSVGLRRDQSARGSIQPGETERAPRDTLPPM